MSENSILDKNQYKRKIYTSPSKNVYENTILIAKVAKQIALKRLQNFKEDLEELGEGEILTDQDVTYRNKIAQKYRKMPQPVIVAIKDIEEGNIMYSYPDKSF